MEHLSQRLLSWASLIDERSLAQAHTTSRMPFIFPHLALMPDAHLGKGATVTATSLRYRPSAEKAAIMARVRDEVWPLINSGEIKVAHETRFSIDEVQQAHEQLTGGNNVGKIVLTF